MEYPVSKDQRKIYNSTFSQKNKEMIYESIVCDVCCGRFTYFNKSRHNKTKRHELFVLRQKMQNVNSQE